MKIALFYEFCQGAGYPFPDGADRQLYSEVLAQAKVADEAGFNCLWSVAHHGSVEVTHMPAPEMFLTAVAVSTKQIKVGHSVVLAPPQLNHPLHALYEEGKPAPNDPIAAANRARGREG